MVLQHDLAAERRSRLLMQTHDDVVLVHVRAAHEIHPICRDSAAAEVQPHRERTPVRIGEVEDAARLETPRVAGEGAMELQPRVVIAAAVVRVRRRIAVHEPVGMGHGVERVAEAARACGEGVPVPGLRVPMCPRRAARPGLHHGPGRIDRGRSEPVDELRGGRNGTQGEYDDPQFSSVH